MKILKGDTVKVIAGGNSKRNKDKGAIGEVLAVNTKDNTVTVKGVNVVVKHVKPNQQNTEGSIKTYEAPIDASNVVYYDTKAKKTVKIGYAIVDGKKVRIDKSTGLPLGKATKKATKEAKVEEAPVVEEAPKAKKTTTKKAEPKAEKVEEAAVVEEAPKTKKTTTKKAAPKASGEEKVEKKTTTKKTTTKKAEVKEEK